MVAKKQQDPREYVQASHGFRELDLFRRSELWVGNLLSDYFMLEMQ